MRGLPHPNQVDDMRRHLELGERIVVLTRRGQELLAKGDRAGAREALEECEACHEERQLLEERWRPAGMGGVEFPASPGRLNDVIRK